MSKKILLNIFVIFCGMAFLVNGQELNIQTKKNELPVKLTISIAENICVGSKFTIVSRLENISKEDFVVNIRKIKRYSIEDSYGEDKSDSFSFPKGKFRFLHTFDSDSPPDDFRVILKPSAK